MQVSTMSEEQCGDLLQRSFIGRLGCCKDNQPYVVPVGFAYEPGYVYVFATLGRKIEWMRENPKVCLQADEIESSSKWGSVIVTGTYLELRNRNTRLSGNMRANCLPSISTGGLTR